jgi:nicotinate dehydrogenase subunit B
MTDEDMMALYGWLMSQPAVASQPPVTQLAFPFNLRPLMAVWNGLFHTGLPQEADATKSAAWNRGAYWVESLGHCGACHTPRNALGAERDAMAYLQGAKVDGWEAPALTRLNRAPLPWTEEELFRYLRHGHTDHHGGAAGPMAQIVREMAAVPDPILRDMATYLASLSEPQKQPEDLQAQARAVVAQAAARAPAPSAAQRQFEGSCGACHHEGEGPKLLGINAPLALNTNVHSDHPDNLIQIILQGLQAPPSREVGFMPSFRHSLNDAQIADIVGWMRSRYAPDRPAWEDLPSRVAALRASSRVQSRP